MERTPRLRKHKRDSIIDFRNDFGSIDHSILFRKIKAIGIEGKLLAWMKNYTEGSTQFVEVNQTISSVRNIDYGIPQGSMFGPRLPQGFPQGFLLL